MKFENYLDQFSENHLKQKLDLMDGQTKVQKDRKIAKISNNQIRIHKCKCIYVYWYTYLTFVDSNKDIFHNVSKREANFSVLHTSLKWEMVFKHIIDKYIYVSIHTFPSCFNLSQHTKPQQESKSSLKVIDVHVWRNSSLFLTSNAQSYQIH